MSFQGKEKVCPLMDDEGYCTDNECDSDGSRNFPYCPSKAKDGKCMKQKIEAKVNYDDDMDDFWGFG